jgi:hypothetical protein
MTKTTIPRLQIQGVRSANGAGHAQRVFHRPAALRTHLPTPLWPGQDFLPLMKGYRRHAPDPRAEFYDRPELSLYLTTLDDAWFVIDNGIDGMVLDRDGFIINETAMFRHGDLSRTGRDLTAEITPLTELDDVFVGNDAAWHNYFHVRCYGVARCHFVQDLVPAGCLLVMPDYASRAQYSSLAYSQATYDQAMAYSGLAQRVSRLKIGLYRARKLRFLWTNPPEPTDSLETPAPSSMFAEIRASLTRDEAAPRRLLVLRDGVEPRMDDDARALTQRMCLERGFTVVRFEQMDLRAQAQAVFNADCIVAPHGAGLVNMLFGQGHLRVLELHAELDGDGSLRACFFQIAAERSQQYMVLNGSRGEINAATLARALDICCCG